MKIKLINDKLKNSIILWLLLTFCIVTNTAKGQMPGSESFDYPLASLLNVAEYVTYGNTANTRAVTERDLLYAGSVGNTLENKIFLNNTDQYRSETWTDIHKNERMFSNEASCVLTIPTAIYVAERTRQRGRLTIDSVRSRSIRLSNVSLADKASIIDVNERSIGYGNATNLSDTLLLISEIEDYQTYDAVCTGTRIFNSNGGRLNNNRDGIQIQMTGAGNLQVIRGNIGQLYYPDKRYGNTTDPYYTVGYQTIILSVGDSFFESVRGWNNEGPLEIVGNTCLEDIGSDGGAQSNTIRLKATKNNLDYYLNVTYSYQYPNLFFNINYNVEIPEGNREEVKLSHGWDSYLGGYDKGPGFKNGNAPYLMVGVKRDDSYEAFKYVSGVPWSSYYSGPYDLMRGILTNNRANTFNNNISSNPNTDNGIGISMNFGSTPGIFNSNNDVVFKCNVPLHAPILRETNVVTLLPVINLNTYYDATSLPTGIVLQWHNNADGSLVSDPTAVPVPGVYYAVFLDSKHQCTSASSAILTVEKQKNCYMLPVQGNKGNILNSAGFMAFTTLQRTNNSWIPQRGDAFIVLESNTKGFVVTRLTTLQIKAIPADKCIPGMLVYDLTENCLKMYNGIKWGCLKQDCL